MVLLEVFREGHDVYLDYPFEDVMFRWEYQTGKVFRKFYGQAEVEIDHTSNLFHEAMSAGQQITAKQYTQGKSADQKWRLEVFQEDVYIDYLFEDVMFRYEHQTGRVFRKFYAEAEVEIYYTSDLLRKAISAGERINAEQYAQRKPAKQK